MQGWQSPWLNSASECSAKYSSSCCQNPLSFRIFLQEAQIGISPRNTFTSFKACCSSSLLRRSSSSRFFRRSISCFRSNADETRASSSTLLTGLLMKSIAPAAKASWRLPKSDLAVTMMTGMSSR